MALDTLQARGRTLALYERYGALLTEHQREVMDLSTAAQVNEVMAALPVDERRAIELAYFAGHTYRQVAVMLDQPEGTVKSRIRSGLRRMRDQLSDAGVGGAWTES